MWLVEKSAASYSELYLVYRVKNPKKRKSPGNKEYTPGVFKSLKEAEEHAERLNNEK